MHCSTAQTQTLKTDHNHGDLSHRHLSSDPFDYPVPLVPSVVLRLSHYGPAIPPAPVLGCFLIGGGDASQHGIPDESARMGTATYQAVSTINPAVILTVNPTSEMT